MKGVKHTQSTIQNVNFKIDPVVKGAAEGVLSGMGLNMSAYIGMCLRQVAQDRKVPFTQSVDPDFWIAESKVSEAKAYIESGAFSAAFDFYLKARDEFNASVAEAALSAYAERTSDVSQVIMLQIAEKEGKTDLGSVGRIVSAGETLAAEVRNIGKMSRAMTDDEAEGDGWMRFCDAYANGIKSAADKVSEAVNEAFESEAGLRNALDCKPSDLEAKEKTSVLDYIISIVLDVADKHPSNLSMRFIGSSGQAELTTVFDALKSMDDYREFLSKADERLRKSKDEIERTWETTQRRILDLIRVKNGVPETQNITQVMPKPEKNLSPDEMIEQAETFKKIMGILNDEDED